MMLISRIIININIHLHIIFIFSDSSFCTRT